WVAGPGSGTARPVPVHARTVPSPYGLTPPAAGRAGRRQIQYARTVIRTGAEPAERTEERGGEDQGGQPGRRARRRRDDADHLAADPGPADPAVPRRRAGLLRPVDPEPRR